MDSPKILVFSGSTRAGSFNHQLAMSICGELEAYGAKPNLISLKNYDMPMYHEDVHNAGLPKTVLEFAKLVDEHDAVVITSPEYNASLSPLLKNTLDWLSLVKELDGKQVDHIKHKPTAIAAAAMGGMGGIRGLSHLRDVLINLGALILTEQLALGNSATAFDENNIIKDKRAHGICQAMCKSVVRHARHPKAI